MCDVRSLAILITSLALLGGCAGRDDSTDDGPTTTTPPPADDCTDKDEYEDPDTLHCYLLGRSLRNWEAAQIECEEWGGALAILATVEEIDMVQQRAPDVNLLHLWLGATDADVEGEWRWANGEPWTFPPGEPPWGNSGFEGPEPNGSTDENCLELYPDRELNDERCEDPLRFLCERERLAEE